LLIILRRSAKSLHIQMDKPAPRKLPAAAAARPRVANRRCAVRAISRSARRRRITREVAQESLRMLGMDEHGLDEVDRNLMIALLDKYAGGPVGVGTLAAALSEKKTPSRKCRAISYADRMLDPRRAARGHSTRV